MLKGKIVVVTGGAGLIGREFVRAIAANGGIAVLADLDTSASSRALEEIEKDYSAQVEAAHLDITDKTSVNTLISGVSKRYGRIDAVVNSAYPRNQSYGRKLEDVTYADFCENVNLHLGGYFLIAQQFGLYFRENGGGNIVNMSSIYGSMVPRFEVYENTPMTMPVEYAAIKSAIIQLTRYFAQYFKGTGIRVNSLSPGGVLDKQPDDFLKKYNSYCNIKGMLAPRDISGVLVFLLSDASEFMTGQNLIVDDGFSL